MKILVIRFSSFGDVVQALSIAKKLKSQFPQAEVHWLTREDFQEIFQSNPNLDRLWNLPRKSGIRELWKMAGLLKAQNFTHVYDAHNSLRSRIVCLRLNALFWKIHVTRKPRRSLRRFFLFQWRLNFFKQPFSGQRDLLEPLKKWGQSDELPPTPVLHTPELFEPLKERFPVLAGSFVAIAPSSAHALKRWPLDYWKRLIALAPEQKFVILGGAEDHFLEELSLPDRVFNLAGKCSFLESAVVVAHSRLLIANDTGVLHLAEQMGHSAIALMGPAPFGFPSRQTTRILERQLPCRPCSKHGQKPCTNPTFHACLRGILPEDVLHSMNQSLNP